MTVYGPFKTGAFITSASGGVLKSNTSFPNPRLGFKFENSKVATFPLIS
jgi:hypothetical protein